MIISIFVPHGGCPERCHFCDQKVSGGTAIPAKKIEETIREHLRSFEKSNSNSGSKQNSIEVAFYGGTFTALPLEIQYRYLKAVQPFIERKEVASIRIATRPDCIDSESLRILKDLGVQTVELGVQSFNPEVLHALGRTHSQQNVADAVDSLRRQKLKVSFHLMLGCPSEGQASAEDQKTIEQVLFFNPDYVRIHPLLVIKGTTLEKAFQAGIFKPIELEEAAQRASRLVEAFEKANINVIRLGLQPNELLGESVVAGAYHPAFGEIVYSLLHRRRIEKMIQKKFGKLFEEKNLAHYSFKLFVPEKILSQVKGQKNSNLQWFKNQFGFKNVQAVAIEND